MITVGSHNSNSAFKQAYENVAANKRDYISLVQNSMPPLTDSNSDVDRFSDHGPGYHHSEPRNFSTIQHNNSLGHNDDDDVYPYNMNPSPQITKPVNVGGLNTSSDIILNSNALKALAEQNMANKEASASSQPQPHVTMRKHTTQARANGIAGGYIKEENYEDDD